MAPNVCYRYFKPDVKDSIKLGLAGRIQPQQSGTSYLPRFSIWIDMAFNIVLLELGSHLLSCVRAALGGDPGDGPCLLGLEALLWGGGINTTINKFIIEDMIAGVCHCGSTAGSCINVDFYQTVCQLCWVIVHNGYHLSWDLFWWAKYFSCRAISRGCARVAIDHWTLI